MIGFGRGRLGAGRAALAGGSGVGERSEDSDQGAAVFLPLARGATPKRLGKRG